MIDASVAVKWYFREEHAENAVEVRDSHESFLVPDLFYAETANAFLKKKARGQAFPGEVESAMADLLNLGALSVMASKRLVPRAFQIVGESGCTIYDALYVALAESSGLFLFTSDRKLFGRLAGFPIAKCLKLVGHPQKTESGS